MFRGELIDRVAFKCIPAGDHFVLRCMHGPRIRSPLEEDRSVIFHGPYCRCAWRDGNLELAVEDPLHYPIVSAHGANARDAIASQSKNDADIEFLCVTGSEPERTG